MRANALLHAGLLAALVGPGASFRAPGRVHPGVRAPILRRVTQPAPIACSASKTLEDEVPRERLIEICNALRERWGSVERIYDTLPHATADGDDDDVIDMDAFMQALVAAKISATPQEMGSIFKAFDLDNSGTLELEEIRLALRESGAIFRTYQQSLTTMLAAIGSAALFAAGIAATRGLSDAGDFATAYIVEDSLSVDNLFVFVLLFEYFRVPLWLQQRCLTLGIAGARHASTPLPRPRSARARARPRRPRTSRPHASPARARGHAGAVVLRGIFIGGGLVLIDKFHGLVIGFGLFLVYSSYSLLAGGDDDEEDDIADNAVVQWATSTLNATSDFDGGRLFTKRGLEPGAAVGEGPLGVLLSTLGRPTPLLLTLICVELCDIVFAVDSIPAVFGVTSDPFIAFTSNIFAIIGLRSLYSVLASAVQDLVRARARGAPPRAHLSAARALVAASPTRAPRPRGGRVQAYLEQSVAIVLGFVGVKLLAEGVGFEIGTGLSLGLIGSVLLVGVVLSLAEKRNELEEDQAFVESKAADVDAASRPFAVVPPVPRVVRISRDIQNSAADVWKALTGDGDKSDP